jgi:hypothetical protein
MFHYDCALSLLELYGSIVALRPTFLITLVNPITWWLPLAMLCLDDRLR